MRGLGGLAGATEEPLEGLLLRVLGRARLDVPHAESDMPAGGHDDSILVVRVLVIGLVQAHIAHDAVDEARREGGGLGTVDVTLEVGWEENGDVGRGCAHFQSEFGATIAAALREVRFG